MNEEWRDIKGYEGLYQVSNKGNVRHIKFNRLLKPSKSGKYITAILSKNGKQIGKSVHRLVAETFIPNPNNYPCVNHKDENPHNNSIENLEWCTHSYNINYGTRNKQVRDKKTKNIIDLNTGIIYDNIDLYASEFGYSKCYLYKLCNKEITSKKIRIEYK